MMTEFCRDQLALELFDIKIPGKSIVMDTFQNQLTSTATPNAWKQDYQLRCAAQQNEWLQRRDYTTQHNFMQIDQNPGCCHALGYLFKIILNWSVTKKLFIYGSIVYLQPS